jgi:hypothetical protein
MCAATMHRQPPPPPPEDDDLQGVHDALLAKGWQARLERRPLFGDEDVRLQVGAEDGPFVQLLGRWGGQPCGDRWHAVRAGLDDRAVWCGPPQGCTKDDGRLCGGPLALRWPGTGRAIRLSGVGDTGAGRPAARAGDGPTAGSRPVTGSPGRLTVPACLALPRGRGAPERCWRASRRAAGDDFGGAR